MVSKPEIVKALSRVGYTNGTKMQESQDPIDQKLHTYHVASTGEAYFKKLREVAKKEIIENLAPSQTQKMDKMVNDTIRIDAGCEADIARAQHYGLDVQVKKGASFFDAKKLRVELLKVMKADKADVIIAECTSKRAPSTSLKVVVL